MPPWHIDKTVGIQEFKNDRSLSDDADRDDRELGRRRHADGQCRRTCRRRAKFADPNRWQLADKLGAQPDLIIRSTPYTLAAHTQDKWFRPDDRDGRHRAALGARDRDRSRCDPQRPQDRPSRARVSRCRTSRK